ncbi:MFS transporter [Candidatus Saccharibacteria bacterium]|nr:MFS transporter [Candidatus Saccharibacteria bacterium]
MLMGSLTPVITPSAYAEPEQNTVTRTANEDAPFEQPELPTQETPTEEQTTEPAEGETNTEPDAPAEQKPQQIQVEFIEDQGPDCSEQLSPVGWLVCPIMEVTSKAVDSLYDVIEGLLVVQPLAADGNSPVYKVWNYCLGITNVVFIVFFLIVIYSQITGVGISNYGIKKVLPKLIVAIVLVNLSFHICALAVDVSNIVGASLRGLFENIPIQLGDVVVSSQLSFSDAAYAALGGASIGLVGSFAAFEAGALFMMIPAIIGGLIAIVSGLITIAIRQAVVILLVMISPLALVCYMLPNTENLFKKWKNLFTKMLVFYPMFSLLFGAANVAGWAIIVSGLSNGSMFMVILGLAVQVFPLFACWSLMKMSGTFLSNVNNTIRGLAAKPLAANRAWAESHKQNSYAKHLASSRSYLPSRYVMKYLSDRKIARELETKENMSTASARGEAYHASSHYKKNGHLTNKGVRAYKAQILNQGYQTDILRHKNTFEEGIGMLAKDGTRTRKRYDALDNKIIEASDVLAMETARSEIIEYDNATSRHKRFENAIATHINKVNAGDDGYLPIAIDEKDKVAAVGRYAQMQQVMKYNKNKEFATQYIAADAASVLASQQNIMKGKFEKYTDLVPPTNYVKKRVKQLAKSDDSSENIDAIIGGLRIFNNRGDTSIIQEVINDLCKDEKLKLGTHASQALAGFLMFEVKDRDSTLRRFGKYINLETAHMYDDLKPGAKEETRRHKQSIDLKEYVDGEYIDGEYVDENKVKHIGEIRKPKRGIEKLLLGTSFAGAEREAFKVLQDTIKQSCVLNPEETDERKQKIDVDKFIKKSANVFNSILPNIVSDQFSYLSGSEQIAALAKFITKPEIADSQLSDDPDKRKAQKEKLAAYQSKRVDDFIFAQVYSQIAKSKSDMFVEIKDHYNDRAAEELGIYKDEAATERDNNRDKYDSEEKWLAATLNNEEWRKGIRNSDKYKDKILKRSSELFKSHLQRGVENSLFLNARKGNLPDSKTGLTEYLDLNNIQKQTEVWNKTHPKDAKNAKNANDERPLDDEEEDDAPSYDEPEPITDDLAIKELERDIDRIQKDYVGAEDNAANRQEFYDRVMGAISGCGELPDETRQAIAQDIRPGNQHISEMYNDVKNRLQE